MTYTYTGYPAVKQAREMIARGEIGDIRFVNAEDAQKWLVPTLEKKKATNRHPGGVDRIKLLWRSSLGDIGSHVENMVSDVTGLRIEKGCARLDAFGEGRTLDDNASIMVNYSGGGRGLYWVSQIAIGRENGLKFRVFGTEGSDRVAPGKPQLPDGV